MSLNHTPGKVTVADLELVDESGRSILNHPLEQCFANINHAAACWNALDGFNPEAVPEMVESFKALLQYEGLVVQYVGSTISLNAKRSTQRQFSAAREALFKLETPLTPNPQTRGS
jgi:hypothetical protein